MGKLPAPEDAMERGGLETYWTSYGAELSRAREGVPLAELSRLCKMLVEARERGARLFVLGNGGSAASASHWVCDFGKGTNVAGGPRFRVASLMDWTPWHSACANDISYADALAEQLSNWVETGDLIVMLSVSGNSENLVRAAAVARRRGAQIASLVGAYRGRLAEMSDLAIIIPSRDYGVVEDIHMVVNHAITQFLRAAEAGCP